MLQLIKPGTRVIADDYTFPMNMRTGSPAFGDVESFLHQVMFNQIWRYYGVPRHNCAGVSSSKMIDLQDSYERAIAAITSALSGANMIALHGSVSSELIYHDVQAILDDDIAGIVRRFIEGEEISDETLATDLIDEVGAIPGYYLDKAHTRKWWMKEQSMPKAADRLTYPEWEKAGKKSCIDYAKERMEEILKTHKVSKPLTDDQEDAIEKILKEAREYCKKKGLISDQEMKRYRESMRLFDT